MQTVSVVIPARNDATALPRAVASVAQQAGVAIDEIVIAVGPSSDGTEAVAAGLAESNAAVRVIRNPTGQTPAALNLAIAATTGQVVVRVDARSVLPSDYVANALETMTATGAANVGAIQLPTGASGTCRAIAAAMNSKLGSGGADYRHATESTAVDTAYLGVFERSALDAVGGYDEGFIRNQDAELNIRLRKAGHEVWLDPRLVVEYGPRSSIRRLASQYWQYGWWRARTVRTHPESIKLRQMAAPILVIGSAVSLALAATVSRLFVALPGLYLAGLVLATFREPALDTVADRVRFAGALATMHVMWGAAFLVSSVTPWRP